MSNLDLDDTNTGTVVPGEAQPAAAVERHEPAEDAGNSEIENRARAQGWVPKEDFRGPADKWKPADEFVRHGEETLPILRERTKTLTSKLSELEARLASTQAESVDKVSRLERMTQTALQRQREQFASSYEVAKRAAVANADQDRYDQLVRDERAGLDAFDREAYAAAQQPQQQQRQSPYSPAQQAQVSDWVGRNLWYANDPEMRAVATIYSQGAAEKTPGITLAENLDATERYMRQRYPEKFPSSQRSGGGGTAVEGGGRMPAAAARGKGFADLPADAKAQFDKFVKEGIYTSKEAGDYAKEYFAS